MSMYWWSEVVTDMTEAVVKDIPHLVTDLTELDTDMTYRSVAVIYCTFGDTTWHQNGRTKLSH